MKHLPLKNFLMLVVSIAILCPITVACTDDEPDHLYTPPHLGSDNQNDKTSRTITSHYEHQSGQDHRSSNNFSTKGMTDGTYIQWTVADGISFDVMYDRTAMSDPTLAHSLQNGSRTKFEGDFVNNDHLYIANPKGATSDFVVTYTIVKDDNTVYVSCNAPHLNGQDHRASDNFAIGSGVFKVECPDGVKFKIREDYDVITDGTLYEELTNGSILNVSWPIDFIYIADVTGADGALMIKFVPYATEWMTYLDDNTEFYSMSIPATHDSGSFYYSGISTCQNFAFREQLDHGIRCFDVRLDGNLITCHGTMSMDTPFDEILTTFNTWLAAHPRESIIMMIKAEQNESDMRNSIKNYFNDSKNSTQIANILRGQSFPKLGAARGKIIMMRRFATPDGEDDSNWGVNIGAGWPDDGTGQYTCSYFKSYIEDRYFSADEAIHDTKEKTEDVHDAISDANSDKYKDYLFLIYNSVAGRLDHTPWDYAWGGGPLLKIDPIMNESLSETLKEFEGENCDKKFRTGMLFLDYYNKHGDDDPVHLVQRIINSNFGEKKIPY